MKPTDYDALAQRNIVPVAQAMMAEQQPLAAIAFLMSAWDTTLRRCSVSVKKESLDAVAAAIDAAGGDGDYFKRTYRRDANMDMAVKTACGHMFWLNAVKLYQNMQRGEALPEEVYTVIELDLYLSGKSKVSARNNVVNPPSIAATPDDAARIQQAVAAQALGSVPVPGDVQDVMRAAIERTMQRHLRRAHMPNDMAARGL